MESAEILVLQASYTNPVHAEAIGLVLNSLRRRPDGWRPLRCPPTVLKQLPAELAKRPHAFSVLAFVGGEPAGLVNCFEGFSTFACRPLVNVHDVAVVPKFRGLGLSQKMLQKSRTSPASVAAAKSPWRCWKAMRWPRRPMASSALPPGMFDPAHGRMMFWTKALVSVTYRAKTMTKSACRTVKRELAPTDVQSRFVVTRSLARFDRPEPVISAGLA